MNLSSFGEEGGEKRKRHAFLSEGPRGQSVSKQLCGRQEGASEKEWGSPRCQGMHA